MTDRSEIPIACTLTGGSYQARLDWIAELARDGLRSHVRRDLVLELRYAPAVVERVREMVRKEQECCGFLTFTLAPDDDGVTLTIAAPDRARGTVDELFDQYAPPIARESRKP